MEQMINKATIAIQQTGLYESAILGWNGFDPVNKDWPNFKSHFGEVYDIRLRSGAGTGNANGYHGASNATNGVNNNSLGSIRESFGAIQVANNANFQVTNDKMSAISEDVQTLRAALVATQQQVALLSHAGATTPQPPVAWPAAVPPPVAYATPPTAYMPPPPPIYAPPGYPPVPTTIYQQSYGRVGSQG